MKVKDLIKLLQAEDPEAVVILQSDGEGNDYSPVRSIWTGKYVAASKHHGTAYDLPEDDATPEDIEAYTEENDLSDYDYKSMLAAPNCVVIYPIN